MVNSEDEPSGRGKVVSARVSHQLYDEVKASGISTADLLKVALGKVNPDPVAPNIGGSIESDPDILAKERELRLARLDRQLAEVRAPLEVTDRMDALEDYLVGLEEYLNDIDSRLTAMSGVLKVVERPDRRVGNLQRQISWLMGVVTQAIPQRLYDLDYRMGRLEKRGQAMPSPRSAPGLAAR